MPSSVRGLLRPFEISLYGALAIAVPVVLASRVLLASSRAGASWVAIAISVVILAFAFVIYAKPRLRRSIVATTLVLGGAALIVAGIASAVKGEREFHPHPQAEVSEDTGDHGVESDESDESEMSNSGEGHE